MGRGNFVNYVYYQASGEFFEILNKRNFAYCVIKGAPLSYLAYGDFEYRLSCDIDLLTDRKNLSFIEKVLLQCSFQPAKSETDFEKNRRNRMLMLTKSHQIFPFVKKVKGIYVRIDLNFDILWGESDENIDVSAFIEDRLMMNIYGHNIYTLSSCKMLICLCLHNYKDINSLYLLQKENPINSERFADIYNLILHTGDDFVADELKKICERFCIKQYIYYMLYYTYKIYNDKKLLKLVIALEDEQGKEILDYYGLHKSERKRWRIPFEERLNHKKIGELLLDDYTEENIEKLKINQELFE